MAPRRTHSTSSPATARLTQAGFRHGLVYLGGPAPARASKAEPTLRESGSAPKIFLNSGWYATTASNPESGSQFVENASSSSAQSCAPSTRSASVTQAIWKSQAVSAALLDQLKQIARSMYSVITSPEQGLENITEWCKKEIAWQRARQMRVELLPELAAELVSRSENEDREADAESKARIDVGLAAVAEVLNYKCPNWKRLREWGLQRRELTPKEDQLLLFAATVGRIPSERQASAILQIRKRLEHEGFVLS